MRVCARAVYGAVLNGTLKQQPVRCIATIKLQFYACFIRLEYSRINDGAAATAPAHSQLAFVAFAAHTNDCEQNGGMSELSE